MKEIEGMLRHVLKSVPGFRPLEASQAKGKDSLRGAPFSNAPVVIEPSDMGSLAKRKTWTMDIDGDSKPFFAHSNEVVTFESLAPYLRELEVHELGSLLSIVYVSLNRADTKKLLSTRFRSMFSMSSAFTNQSHVKCMRCPRLSRTKPFNCGTRSCCFF